MGFFRTLQKLVNSTTGGYREAYFKRYPGPTYTCKGCGKEINRDDRNGVHIDGSSD